MCMQVRTPQTGCLAGDHQRADAPVRTPRGHRQMRQVECETAGIVERVRMPVVGQDHHIGRRTRNSTGASSRGRWGHHLDPTYSAVAQRNSHGISKGATPVDPHTSVGASLDREVRTLIGIGQAGCSMLTVDTVALRL